MKLSFVQWLLVLNLFMLCGLAVFFTQKHHQRLVRQESEQVRTESIIREAEKNDTTPEAEKIRLRQIANALPVKRTVTNDDLAFLLAEMNKHNGQKSTDINSLTASLSMFYLKRPLPHAQKAILYEHLTPMLAAQDHTAGSGITNAQLQELEACDLVARFDVRQATPQILPLLNDPKPQIRNVARRTLKKLGYNV